MQIGSLIAIFFVVWWLSFVAVLPIGDRSQSELGTVVPGTDPGAPAAPHIGRKLIIATIVACVMTGLLFWGISNETLHHYWNR